jgi:hypothetical protein
MKKSLLRIPRRGPTKKPPDCEAIFGNDSAALRTSLKTLSSQGVTAESPLPSIANDSQVTVHGPPGDWSVFRLIRYVWPQRVGRKHGPVPGRPQNHGSVTPEPPDRATTKQSRSPRALSRCRPAAASILRVKHVPDHRARRHELRTVNECQPPTKPLSGNRLPGLHVPANHSRVGHPSQPLARIIHVGWVKVAQILGGARKLRRSPFSPHRPNIVGHATEAPPIEAVCLTHPTNS